jgi:hypothetical protein
LRSSLDDFWGDSLADLKRTAEARTRSRRRRTG